MIDFFFMYFTNFNFKQFVKVYLGSKRNTRVPKLHSADYHYAN